MSIHAGKYSVPSPNPKLVHPWAPVQTDYRSS